MSLAGHHECASTQKMLPGDDEGKGGLQLQLCYWLARLLASSPLLISLPKNATTYASARRCVDCSTDNMATRINEQLDELRIRAD
jgi:hypothetical protein